MNVPKKRKSLSENSDVKTIKVSFIPTIWNKNDLILYGCSTVYPTVEFKPRYQVILYNSVNIQDSVVLADLH